MNASELEPLMEAVREAAEVRDRARLALLDAQRDCEAAETVLRQAKTAFDKQVRRMMASSLADAVWEAEIGCGAA